MISIRKYLYAQSVPSGPAAKPADGFTAALASLSSALLGELGEQARVENEPLAVSLQEFQPRIDAAVTPEAIEGIGGEISSLLANYRSEKQQSDRREAQELQEMVAVLHRTIEALARGNDRTVGRLASIEGEIRSASQISDIVALKDRLRVCVGQVHEAAEAERRDFTVAKNEIEHDFRRAQEGMALARSGLPGRSELERRITESEAMAVLLVIVADRQPTVKSRYGTAIGEKYMLRFFGEVLARLPSSRKPFRWNESAIVVELPDDRAAQEVEGDVRERFASLPGIMRLDVGGRIAVLENAYRWFAITPDTRKEDILGRIEGFLGT